MKLKLGICSENRTATIPYEAPVGRGRTLNISYYSARRPICGASVEAGILSARLNCRNLGKNVG